MSSSPNIVLRLGTRGSLLARTQSRLVADALEQLHPNLRVELVTVRTSGDRITDRPLHDVGGKGLFTKEIEQALLGGDVDFAVHSFKDVPVTMPLVEPGDLVIAAVPRREDPRDVLASPLARRIGDLPRGARVGTGSLRRRCQLLTIRPDLQVESVRGNIDTRLRKLRGGQFDAIVLAAAGLNRAGLFDDAIMSMIDSGELLPAPGQGALALQCRRGDGRTRSLLSAMNDADTAECVDAERAVVAGLGGDCHSPIAALATPQGDAMLMRAAVGARGGDPPVVRAVSRGPRGGGAAAESVLTSLTASGAEALLHPNGQDC
jgi:hydroxymethylbilane synthase